MVSYRTSYGYYAFLLQCGHQKETRKLPGNREGIPGLLGEFNIRATTVGWGLGLGSYLRLASVQTVVSLFD